MKFSKKKILAVASHGGHWVQLNRLNSSFYGHQTLYISTFKARKKNYRSVVDANMDKKLKLLIQFLQLFFIILAFRPHVIISTGASVGFFSLLIGRIFRCKTIWVDSIANGEEMSLSGKKVKRFANIWLSQWPDVAKKEGALYKGKVL